MAEERMNQGHTPQLLMVRVRADLSREGERDTLYSWLDRWRNSMTKCSRSGGVWDERFEVILPSDAVDELPRALVNSIASPLPNYS
jgi:hypothetical protein